MPDNSFDVVSKIELPEVSNAIQQAMKEIIMRFDLKDSHSQIELNEKDNKILLASKDEFKLKAVNEILQQKLVKRKVPLKGLTYGAVIQAAGSTVKQEVTLQQGIPIEKAREIVKKIKDSKLKVQAAIQGDLIRVSGRDRDTLQQAIALLARRRFRHRHAVHQLPDQLVARRIESHLLDGPAGKLEALLEPPEDREPVEACVVCHPHPLYSAEPCTTKSCHRIARGLRRRGSVVLRFNFRGVGRSEGNMPRASVRSTTLARRSTGCAAVIPICPTRSPASLLARA